MDLDFQLSSYFYDLPSELIAQNPLDKRDQSRLLIFDQFAQEISEGVFENLLNFLPPRSTLVFNQSAVFPSRLLGKKETGGIAEIFILNIPNSEALIKTTGKKKVGDKFIIHDAIFEINEILNDGIFKLKTSVDLEKFLDLHGHIPLPHYIRDGVDDEKDRIRYQTVFAQEKGSVAAPTAGLHFTNDLLEKLKSHGHEVAFVTLHVGLGTFRPVKSEDIRDHQMHEEKFYVDPVNQEKIKQAQNIIAVGTTTLRVLESCYQKGFHFPNDWSKTQIFLYPGKKVQSIKGLITNFHLPESSLLMLVASIIGREKILNLYKYAIEHRFRFFSYGDAMLIKLVG